jgi:hypothetical protein
LILEGVPHVATHRIVLLRISLVCALATPAARSAEVLDAKMHHLRSGDQREWSDFPEHAEGRQLVIPFDAKSNASARTLRLRHRDLKQEWKLALNGKEIGKLPQDENPMLTYWVVPPGALRDGANELTVSSAGGASDDVEIGDVALLDETREKALSESSLDVTVIDKDSGRPLPCRITVVDPQGSLVDFGTRSDGRLAIRPGVIYTVDGRAQVKLATGRYTVYAGRGFEYGIDSAQVDLKSGAAEKVKLSIRREVPTDGYVACDTHVHTWTYSRHGDATLAERMMTLAGEGIELPIATDHNLQVDYEPAAKEAGVRGYFTPVMGNEVTTSSVGHFNVFPVPAGAKLINWRVRDWDAVSRNIAEVARDEPVIILNHARDLHGGFRPFDPKRHIAVAGEDLDGWKLPANAMEVVNSGAVMTDPMRLVQDWMGLLNRGLTVTPVGASDSHDISRYIVGQGRTYVRCDDADPGNIDVRAAVRSLREGRVLVSYGLLADIAVVTPEGRFGPGELARVPKDGPVEVELRVLGPAWTRASKVTFYSNGFKVREQDITTPQGRPEPAGVKWQGRWTVRPRHDAHLVAVVTGPGVAQPYWPTGKPYQPTSPEFAPYVMGISGAVRVDADGSGTFTSAHDYAGQLLRDSGQDPRKLGRALSEFDGAVGAQVASLLAARLGDGFEDQAELAAGRLMPAARRGIAAYVAERREATAARAATAPSTRPARP